ncbi:MAG: ATP-binding protein, partial [Alphaproteobacteria bacterium]
EFHGNGVGLTICRQIIERHGGQIQLESTLGEGARFEFSLPMTAEMES